MTKSISCINSNVDGSNALVSVLRAVVKLPGLKVDRDKFLQKELQAKKVPQANISIALRDGIRYSNIDKNILDKIAVSVINRHTWESSMTSFVSGIPGGFAMIGTIPADISQYYFHTIRTVQKLAYIYGWPEFDFDEGSEDSIQYIIILLGVMSGVDFADQAIKAVSKALSQKALKRLPKMALTKGWLYPIVKKIATLLGFKMSKTIFADGVAKIVPVLGGIFSGGLTAITFRPACTKLQRKLSSEL